MTVCAIESPGAGVQHRKAARIGLLLAVALSVLSLVAAPLTHAQEPAAKPLILTSLAPVYELAAPLVENTGINLQLLPDSPRSMQTHQTLFVRQADRYAGSFAQADAVITIGKVWAADPLYISARHINPRVVNIDASKPYSHELDGVAVANSPIGGQPSLYFWLSPSNVVRMLDIIGNDLLALYPAEAAALKINLVREQDRYRALKAEAETRLLQADDPLIYALADEFVYLSSDLGLFVAGYFVKQDIDWTEADYQQLTQTLQSQAIKVVIHKWEPAAPIIAAIQAAGARLVVLDTLETTADFYAGFAANLDLLMDALQNH
jgi:ABC-type Zn uptake system ZnuABC Zn-binding protein ZnuA